MIWVPKFKRVNVNYPSQYVIRTTNTWPKKVLNWVVGVPFNTPDHSGNSSYWGINNNFIFQLGSISAAISVPRASPRRDRGKERGLLSRTAAIAQIKIFHSQSLRHKASMLMNPTPVFLPYLYATICGPRVVTLSLCPSRVTRKKNGRVSSPGFYAAISPRGFLQSRSTNKPKEARKRHHSQWPKPKLFVWTLPFIKFPILFVCKQSRTKL